MRSVLLVDCMFICYRAYFSLGKAMGKENPVGMIFGFLRDIFLYIEEYSVTHTLFAFDSKILKRREIYPEYKKNRQKERTKEEQESIDEFFRQIKRIKGQVLPDLGFLNVVEEEGFEADDLIARVARGIKPPDSGVMLTSDKDLYQCITESVSWKNPNKPIYTFKDFVDEWGMHPGDWGLVKAVEGCPSDGVKGVKGIGTKRAVEWINGKLDRKSKYFEKISDSKEIINRNYKLTVLPHEDTPPITLHRDRIDEAKKVKAFENLGLQPPRARRRIKRLTDRV